VKREQPLLVDDSCGFILAGSRVSMTLNGFKVPENETPSCEWEIGPFTGAVQALAKVEKVAET